MNHKGIRRAVPLCGFGALFACTDAEARGPRGQIEVGTRNSVTQERKAKYLQAAEEIEVQGILVVIESVFIPPTRFHSLRRLAFLAESEQPNCRRCRLVPMSHPALKWNALKRLQFSQRGMTHDIHGDNRHELSIR